MPKAFLALGLRQVRVGRTICGLALHLPSPLRFVVLLGAFGLGSGENELQYAQLTPITANITNSSTKQLVVSFVALGVILYVFGLVMCDIRKSKYSSVPI